MQYTNTRRGQTQKIKNAVYKNCHSRMFLSGILTTFNNKKGGDTQLQISGMTPLFNTPHLSLPGHSLPQGERETSHGFTLIELLVVVLIIGILAAVALPQYNKAVKKAQGTEALLAFDTYDKAMAAYYLEHGTYEGITTDTLGVKMPILKHFKYTNNGSRSFDFQIGSGTVSLSNLYIENPSDTTISIAAEWKNGKLTKVRCSSSKCGQYFNCNWQNRNLYPGDDTKYCNLR